MPHEVSNRACVNCHFLLKRDTDPGLAAITSQVSISERELIKKGSLKWLHPSYVCYCSRNFYKEEFRYRREAYIKMFTAEQEKGFCPFFPYTPSIPLEEAIKRQERGEAEESAKPKFPKKLSVGINWEQITIRFLDGHNVDIIVGNTTHKTNYKEMGFENRKSRKPNDQWEFLFRLAHCHGKISWGDAPSEKSDSISRATQELDNSEDDNSSSNFFDRNYSIIRIPNSDKKKKQLLSKALASYFKIAGDPFYDYKKEKGYRIRIRLLPEGSTH